MPERELEYGRDKEQFKVVVRYRDGRVTKGFSYNFSPNRDQFHLFPADHSAPKGTPVQMKDVKAVFTVRDFAGNSQYSERKDYMEGERPAGRKVEVIFHDGEVMVGSTLGYDSNRECFCLFPADPKSNNVRVFVVLSAVQRVRRLDTVLQPPKALKISAQI